MSVISSTRILDLIQEGKMYLSPILCMEQIGAISVDLRLGNMALLVRGSGTSHVDPRVYAIHDAHGTSRTQRQKFDQHEFMFREQFLLHPGSLALVPTLEWIKLPTNVKGVVTARSCWAREGLNIATANFINPGYNGIITLELSNLGQIPIALFAGMRIAQIAFHDVTPDVAGEFAASQFQMSFEPRAGDIVKHDRSFIPFDSGNRKRSKSKNA
jgi:dCTP deaminase